MCYMNCISKRFDLFLKVNGKYQLICQERRKLEPTLIKMSESCRSVLCKYNVVVLLFTFDGSFGNNHRIGDTARMKWFVHYTDLINLGR